MKTLLAAIQTALRSAGSLSYIADTDIVITSDESLLPVTISFPAIGLKDGFSNILIEDGADWERTLSVDIIVYQLLKAGDISLMSQTSPRVYGVFEISEAVHAVLFDNKLGISEIEAALPTGESASEIVSSEDVVIVARKLTYQYRKLEVNP